MADSIEITQFAEAEHRRQVVALWESVFGYDAPHNAPGLVIDKKLAVADGLFFVALHEDEVVGTVLAGYDGHRGWIYSLAVLPNWRNKGVGSSLLTHAENMLSQLGCVKINLQIMDGNEPVQHFYQANGYGVEKRISMGKRLG